MRAFREQTAGLTWEPAALAASLGVLFGAVDDLAEKEARYYYRRRGTRAWLSGVTRTCAWLFGSMGLLLPLLASTDGALFRAWGPYGYAFLALAASALAANALFGGSEGHVRFVATQLELEKLITASRIAWCEHLAGLNNSGNMTPEEREQGFALILGYATKLHETAISETGRWGEALIAELAQFRDNMTQGRGAGA